MIDVIDLNSKRPPVNYTVCLSQGHDGSLTVNVHDIAEDDRSRRAVAVALLRAAQMLESLTGIEDPDNYEQELRGYYYEVCGQRNDALQECAKLNGTIRALEADKAGETERIKAEREACARLCDDVACTNRDMIANASEAWKTVYREAAEDVEEIAKFIRARGTP